MVPYHFYEHPSAPLLNVLVRCLQTDFGLTWSLMLNQMLANKDDIPTFENLQKTMHKNVVKYLGWVLVFD